MATSSLVENSSYKIPVGVRKWSFNQQNLKTSIWSSRWLVVALSDGI